MLESLPVFSVLDDSGVCSDTEPVVAGACSSKKTCGDYNWHVSKSLMTGHCNANHLIIRCTRLIDFQVEFHRRFPVRFIVLQGHDCEPQLSLKRLFS